MNADNKNISIRLRALEPDDIDLLYKWENDETIWKVSNTIAPFSRHILRKYIENSHLDIFETKQLRLMIDNIDEKGKSKTIGAIDLFEFDPLNNRAGIGILIGEKGDRRKGFASEALDKLIQYAFNILHLHQLFCNIGEENTESLSLFQKKGFKITGTKIDWLKSTRG